MLAISGGVGGAKLALGLSRVLPADELVIAVNTGDDFEHLGLTVCPDIDTVLYTLAGINDSERGWGVAGETWACMEQLERVGGETWFRLGDRDLALHLQRTHQLQHGLSLSAVTENLARQLGVAAAVWPMSDDPVRTIVNTDAGALPFQQYFVREQCRPRVKGFEFVGADGAQPLPALLALLRSDDLRAVIICPSNPFVSVGPLLAMPVLRAALQATRAPVIAVSPIVGGQALKGPAAKMMAELALPVTAAAVAAHYGDLLDGFVMDEQDAAQTAALAGTPVCVTHTVMKTRADREQLARDTLAFAEALQ
ncbi:MAG TPA: 2-phospho-L-lactate transferase [Pseudomonadales bacterium]